MNLWRWICWHLLVCTRIFFSSGWSQAAGVLKQGIYLWYNLGGLSCSVKQRAGLMLRLQSCTLSLSCRPVAHTWWFNSYRRTVWAWFSLPLCNVSRAVRICAVRLCSEGGEREPDLVVQASAEAPYYHLNITEGWWWCGCFEKLL